MLLHDTHAHLDLLLQKMGAIPSQRDLDLEHGSLEHIEGFELKKKTVEELIASHDFLIHPTVSTRNFWLVYNLFKSFPRIYFMLGSHPEIVNSKFDFNGYMDEQQDLIVDLETDSEMMNQVVGIGEVGLDYYYSKDTKITNLQKKLFISQVELAIRLHLPLIIHCREAFDDLLEILNSFPKIHGKFVIHCFTGSIKELEGVLDLGGKIGVSGIVTFNSGVNVQEAVERIQMEDFLIETDLPYLAPEPNRGKICMPHMIAQTVDKIAEIKGISPSQVLKQSATNAEHIFGSIF